MGQISTIEEPDKSNEQAIRKVLVVDDSRLQRRIITAGLSRFGFDVQEAASGIEALELCQDELPDLVISDWMMPEMNGVEFCREFRALSDNQNYGYFILATSKSEKEEIAHGLDAGADDFVSKPVSLPELRARISAGERIISMQRQLSEKNRLIKSTLDELQKLYDAIDNDLIEAKKLQQSLVSERFKDFGYADVSLLLRSSGHVGGDLVGFFPVSDTRIGLYAIDVSGHGISSALLTARLAGYLSATAPDQNVALQRLPDGSFSPRPTAETVSDLNELLLDEIETEHYFTMLLADVTLDTGTVILTQAGHPSPAIQRADGSVEIVGTGGMPVGLIAGANYEQFEISLNTGDRLLMHSDGVDECADPNDVLLGEDGISDLMKSMVHLKGQDFHEALIWELAEFSQRDEFSDDVSAVLLEFKDVQTIA